MTSSNSSERTSWIWQEAKKIAEKTQDKDVVVFQTGYGPSGLPHIGTFAEVARTSMVRKAFEVLTGKKTRLIVFSDDVDALRKVPSNVPNPEMLKKYIGITLSQVPNPFDTSHKSYAEHNNAKLQEFLDAYGFEYEFISSYESYNKGVFNETLRLIADNARAIKEVVTENYGTSGSDRKKTYCPFIPIDKETGKHYIFLEPDWRIEGDILYYKPLGTTEDKKISIKDGNVKCQWKVDWPLRWINYEVDYEMHGGDLIDSARTGIAICNLLKKIPPITFMYELFLDEHWQKISKSKGNGIEFSEWVRYAPQESLQWLLYQNPNKTRRLFFGVIPKAVDSFIDELNNGVNENNATWAIYKSVLPKAPPVSYQMLLNLVNIAHTSDPDVIWKYIQNYQPDIDRNKEPLLATMIQGAISYYKDKVEPFKSYKVPTDAERKILLNLADRLEEEYVKVKNSLTGKELAEHLMFFVYEVGKKYFENNKDILREQYFKMLYQVLMGQDTGPRFGQFVVAYGVENSIALLREKAAVK